MIHRDADGWYFLLRITRRFWFVLGRWNRK